ncbi:MAG: Hsp70 family protein [Planctomycetota bacterium]
MNEVARDPTTPGDDDHVPPARYCIGIDLGTTNCVLAYVDTCVATEEIQTFPVPQWVALDAVESRPSLPSFHATLTPSQQATFKQNVSPEIASWLQSSSGTNGDEDEPIALVGQWARLAGLDRPGRQIASAKSWLSHANVDRSADLLPWHGEDDVPRHSPTWASAAYLTHLRQAWDAVHPDEAMADQDVTITLPASFDEVARELTVDAARRAGLTRISLIEEPQAAFYAWLSRNRHDWSDCVSAGQLILVCDIGGGTTDLTLIRARPADNSESVQFHRVAVGNHLILGGDNLDLAIARSVEQRLLATGVQPLSPRQWQRLIGASRGVKETMLSANSPASMTVHLPGEGASLLDGGLDASVTSEHVEEVLLDGFFPIVPFASEVQDRGSGFQEMGLPYASDPAITRHLATFLRTHHRTGLGADSIDSDRVDWVLFNGGVLTAPAIQRRILACLTEWFGGGDANQVRVLESPQLDRAVAEGAASYGLVRRGIGTGITANLARSYFMQVHDDPPQAVCVVPADAEAGQSFRLDQRPMQLQTGVPVVLPLWVSSTRLADRPGDLIEIDPNELTPLPPIQTALRDRKRKNEQTIDVVLESELTEIGTVDLYCVQATHAESARRWKLNFDIRGTLETDRGDHGGLGESEGVLDEGTIDVCRDIIASVFGDGKERPSRLMKRLQEALGQSRDGWPPVLLRQMWSSLLEYESGRRRSPAHEICWLNLLGFSLRPGYGVAVDDWRTSRTWRSVQGKLIHDDPRVRVEASIVWRRIAGGLTSGQQSQLASAAFKRLESNTSKSAARRAGEVTETWRLVGSLERLTLDQKADWLTLAERDLENASMSPWHLPVIWALGRLASRVPAYGPVNLVLSPSHATDVVSRVLRRSSWTEDSDESLAVTSLAMTQISRRCHDRFRDLPDSIRYDVVQWLEDHQARAHLKTLVTDGGTFDRDEQASVLGDSLPLGITIRSS